MRPGPHTWRTSKTIAASACRECWLVSPQAYTVEVLRLSPEGLRTVGIDGAGMHVSSEILEGLDLPVEAIFA
jgi:Uma2 family endonuclease